MVSEIVDEISDELKAELDRRYTAYEKNPSRRRGLGRIERAIVEQTRAGLARF